MITKVIINYDGPNGYEQVELTGESAESFHSNAEAAFFDIPNGRRAIPTVRLYDVLFYEDDE